MSVRATLVGLALTLTFAAGPVRGQEPVPRMRTCWCYRWVHRRDFGTDCLPSRARCEHDRGATSHDTSRCERSEQAECVRDGYEGGRHRRLPTD